MDQEKALSMQPSIRVRELSDEPNFQPDKDVGGAGGRGGGGSVDSDESTLDSDDFTKDSNSASFLSHQSTSDSKRSTCKPLAPHSSYESSWNNLEFTVDKLRISELGLHGRDQELKKLMGCFEKVVAIADDKNDERTMARNRRQLVLISGSSGTGKTTLANTLTKPTIKRKGLFVRGKFDLHQSHEPYSGIAAACADICGHILSFQKFEHLLEDDSDKPSFFDQICQRVRGELGTELLLMNRFIPALGQIMDIEIGGNQDPSNNATAAASSKEARNRFIFAFKRYMRIISDQFPPLVFVLDDLQWSDQSSLDLLDAIMSDSEISQILVVGIYRSNEVDKTHIVYRSMEDFTRKSQEDNPTFGMTEIKIGNLDIANVNEVIKDLLAMDNDVHTLDLAQVCLSKTDGNPFFLLHYLKMLHENGSIRFNYGTLRWSWDIKEIADGTSISANVVELLAAKMAKLASCMVQLLKLAACLGSTFEEKTLQLVWNYLQKTTETLKPDNNKQDDSPTLTTLLSLQKGLDSIEEGGFIKCQTKSMPSLSSSPSKSYSWTHDKIQEAAASLLPEEDQASFKQRIGQILLTQLEAKDLDSAIFVVAKLLNSNDPPRDPQQRVKLVQLNYDACCKAKSLSAFEGVADYAAAGIALLENSDHDINTFWSDHYKLTLGLYLSGASAESYLGDVQLMEKYCTAILSRDDIPIEDKLPCYNILLDSFSNRGKLKEAIDLSLEILGKFGGRFPKRPIPILCQAVSGLIMAKVRGKHRCQQAAQLIPMREKLGDSGYSVRLELLKVLDKLGTTFYLEGDMRVLLNAFRG